MSSIMEEEAGHELETKRENKNKKETNKAIQHTRSEFEEENKKKAK